MTKTYSIAAARSGLPAIVDQVESGEEIQLTRRGKPVAVVVSIRQMERLRGRRVGFGAAYREFLAKHSLKSIGLEKKFFDGARDKGNGRPVDL